VLYFGGLAIETRLTGWKALARLYPDQPMIVDRRLYGTVTTGSLSVFIKRHRGARIDLGNRGLRISPSIFARFAHPPFMIPWSAVQRCEPVPTDWVKVRLRVEGIDGDLAVFLRNAPIVLRACREHHTGLLAPPT